MKETIESILYDARTEKQLTVRDLARSADLSANAIYSWERGERSPMVSNLQRLCKTLQISITIDAEGKVHRVNEN